MNKFEFPTDNVQIIIGKIVRAEGETTINPGGGPTYTAYTTASVSYVIATYVPGTSSYVEMKGQKPEIRLWPQDQEIAVGELEQKSVIGVKVVNNIRWHFFEPPVVDACFTPPPSPIIGAPSRRDVDPLNLAPIESGNTGGPTPTSPPQSDL